jgi:hypothetical protein
MTKTLVGVAALIMGAVCSLQAIPVSPVIPFTVTGGTLAVNGSDTSSDISDEFESRFIHYDIIGYDSSGDFVEIIGGAVAGIWTQSQGSLGRSEVTGGTIQIGTSPPVEYYFGTDGVGITTDGYSGMSSFVSNGTFTMNMGWCGIDPNALLGYYPCLIQIGFTGATGTVADTFNAAGFLSSRVYTFAPTAVAPESATGTLIFVIGGALILLRRFGQGRGSIRADQSAPFDRRVPH